MPRYDDRYNNTRLYVGHLSSRTRSRDLERLFNKYGRFLGFGLPGGSLVGGGLGGNSCPFLGDLANLVRDVDMKRDYAFVDFSDPRDADDARYGLDGREFDGSRIIVEFAKGVPRGSREYLGRGPPPGTGRCFNCGIDGHWARDCKSGDWKNKCYRCGERGHIEKNCKNSPKKLRRYSASPSRSRSPRRGRSRSRSNSRGRDYSRSRSPVRRERSIEREERSRSPRYRRSPDPRDSPIPSKTRNRSPKVDEGSPRDGGGVSPANGRIASRKDVSDDSISPRQKSRSPSESNGRKHRSPSESNGRGRSYSRSRSPEYQSPVDVDDDNHQVRRGRGGESP